MDNHNRASLKSGILEEKIYGKMTTPKNKITSEFIEEYIVIALIPFTIYQIGIYTIRTLGHKALDDQQFSIESIVNFSDIATNLSYNILAFSIIFVLSNFLVVFFSSKFIFRKYKARKEDFIGIMKVIIILQIIFTSISTLYYYVSYNDEIGINNSYISKFEWLESNNKKTSSTNYDIKKYITDINKINQINLAILIIVNFVCIIFCVFWQSRILKFNSI